MGIAEHVLLHMLCKIRVVGKAGEQILIYIYIARRVRTWSTSCSYVSAAGETGR
jgi:hypothetical protein